MQRYGSIYLIRNRVNGKCYVGQTTSSVSTRWSQHKSIAKRGEEDSPFMRALRKYGSESFEVSEIAVSCDAEALDEAEDKCIEQFETLAPHGYNLCLGNGGHRHNEQTKIKIRQHRHTDETRLQMSDSQKKRYRDPEQRWKQARVQSDEERRKRSETMKRLGHRPKLTPEVIAKISASLRGKPSKKARPIIDQNGCIYPSMQAAADALDLDVSAVSMVVNGHRPHTKGYKFSYATTTETKESA